MKNFLFLFSLLPVLAGQNARACEQCKKYNDADFKVTAASITHHKNLGVLVGEIQVKGQAGKTQPTAIGRLDGPPVLGYVFPATLKARDIGFSQTEGIVAMAPTSHPDFDDTPLWGKGPTNTNVRIIAATSRDLEKTIWQQSLPIQRSRFQKGSLLRRK